MKSWKGKELFVAFCALQGCILVLSAGVTAESAPGQGQLQDPQGDRQCEWSAGAAGGKKAIPRFPVLPGGGWDNLRNEDMGPVADLSLRDCDVSVDGLYVIPSQVVLYPIKESRVSLMSEVMEHYENYTSTTSKSVNAGGSGSFFDDLFGISGGYSEEFQEVKRTALYSKTQIGHTQQRYNMYLARMVPEFRLSNAFRNRLMDIGTALISNSSKQARYMSDLLVRDFGTHVVTSVDAGAVLEKIDYFKRDSLSSSVYTTNKISQCMSVDFMSIFSAESSFSLAVSNEELKGYRNTIQKTSVNTHGGPAMGAKVNLTRWERGLTENLVAIDRVGDLLFTVINHRSLPELPTVHLKEVIDSVKDAVTRYYQVNEVKGCLDPDSPNFEPLANVEGSCETPLTNFSFGGVYQTCQESEAGLCGQPNSPQQVNYITGGYSCPEGYEPVQLISVLGRYERYECRVFGFRFDWCQRWTRLTSYWCAARRDNPPTRQQSGAIYGGAFSPRFDNPATGAKACGGSFRPHAVGRDISLCIGADMRDVSLRSRVPLGGFFSCAAGNPLAEPGRPVVALHSRQRRSDPPPAPTPQPAPKRCPDGFTQATLDVVDGCELMQCARIGRGDWLRRRRQMARRPPFEEPPGEWATIAVGASQKGAQGGGSGGSAAIGAMVCGVALAVAVAAAFGFVLHRQRRQRRLRLCSGNSDELATERQPLLSSSSGSNPVGGGGGVCVSNVC